MLRNIFDGPPIELVEQILHALKRSGGLAKRVARPKLTPAFDAAIARLIAVYNAWDEAGYRAMVSKARPTNTPPELDHEELAFLKGLHGACKGFTPVEVTAPFSATVGLQCERGTLELEATINPVDGLVSSFTATSKDLPAPPNLAEMADRLAGMIERWDEGFFTKSLAPNATKTHDQIVASFDALRGAHASCKVKSFKRWTDAEACASGFTGAGHGHEFALTCRRGGDLQMKLQLNEKNPNLVWHYGIVGGGTCPVK